MAGGLRIRSVATTAGFLEKAPIELADGLTCIIGARGTCKSTLVETIRFAFDADPKRVAALLGKRDLDAGPDLPAVHGLVKTTLGTGTARCEVKDDDGSVLVLEREVDADAPRVLREGIRERSPGVLHRIEIYSQGDLQRIAEDGTRRLDLIDRPHRARIEELVARRLQATRELKDVGVRIRALRATVEAKRAELKELPALAAQLRSMQEQRPELSPAFEQERQAWLERQKQLQKLDGLVQKRQGLLQGLLATAELEGEFREAAKDLKKHRSGPPLAQALAAFADLLGTAREQAEAQSAVDASGLLAKLKAQFEEQDQAYQKMQQGQQEAGARVRQEDRLRAQVAQMESSVAELAELEKQEKAFLKERAKRRNEITKLSDEIFKLRSQQVGLVNAEFEGVVQLALSQGTRSAEYRAVLDRLLQGSRLRGQSEIARDLATKVPPFELVDAIEAGDSQLLAAHLERDKTQIAKLVAFLGDNPALYELEAVVFEDQLEISMLAGGVAKPVQQLSKGQMATALLPLILRDAEYPLVFDQPEDDLDNRFIYNTLVQHIRDLKKKRQLVFVTHNANIPVLGDADRVVVMQMETPTKAAAPLVGSVDEVKDQILALLEGGAEAFKERKKRYGKLVS